ncbi:MAG: electron transport complex subunit RsxG [Pseudomonadota bacterium]
MKLLANFSLSKLRAHVGYQSAAMGILCTLVTLLLMTGQQVTAEDIKLRLEEDRLELLSQVLPATYYDNVPLEDVVEIHDPLFSSDPIEVFVARMNNEVSSIVFEMKTEGYGGTMKLFMSLNPQGQIVGLRVLSHKETPGLADKLEISKSDWITTFNGLSLASLPREKWAVKKDGGDFDQFTGATITPRAVVNRVLNGLDFFERHKRQFSNPDAKVKQDKEVADE